MEKTYDYTTVLEQIENARRFGKEPGVVVTRKVLEALNHPEEGLPYIQVAGTNGKGSTSAFLEALAMDAGYRVGKFTSPHLICFNERITVNGKQISNEDVTRLGAFLLEQKFEIELTMFDYCLVMALLYFKEQNCDLVILEVGLGGRLDSTSALKSDPLVSVITKIGYDHMAILGNTLAEIASEKAGIMRPNVPAVSARQEAESEEALVVARTGIRFVTEADIDRVKSLSLQMIGDYQLENAATALVAAEIAFARMPNPKSVKAEALCKANWPGRMQILCDKPFLMVDGAHNSHGVTALAESLKKLYEGEKFHFVMGVMADKDYLEMIQVMLPLAIDFVTVTPESSRALQGQELASLIEEKGIPARFESDWQKVLAERDYSAKWICFGSLYFIGDVIKAINIKNI